MAQSQLTIRIDSDLKKQFDSLCEEFGMSTNTAFNIYVRTVVREKKIPFTVAAVSDSDIMESGRQAFYRMREQAVRNGIAGMSLEDINAEITAARADKR
jgi:DNA-damage-inducible protein J